MLRALAVAVNAYLSEAIVVGIVVGAVVVIASEGRSADATAVEIGDTATAVLMTEDPLCSYGVKPQLEPPVIEIPTDYEARRIYRTPDLHRQAPLNRPAWTGDWF